LSTPSLVQTYNPLLTHTHLLFFLTLLLMFIITTMADIEILLLHFDLESVISYPPSIITKQLQLLSTIPIIPSPDLFAATSFDISNIQPCPELYPLAACCSTYIIARRFRFSHSHPHIPCDIWHIMTHPTSLLHSGVHVTIQGYGVVDIWELHWFSTLEWVVY
jgi:hypothetical protein